MHRFDIIKTALLCFTLACFLGCGNRSATVEQASQGPSSANSDTQPAASDEPPPPAVLSKDPAAWAAEHAMHTDEMDLEKAQADFRERYLGGDGDVQEALDLFPVLDDNPSLTAPLLSPVLTAFADQKGRPAAMEWLAENQELLSAPHAASTLGTHIAKEELSNSDSAATLFDEVLAGNLKSHVKEPFLLGIVKAWLGKNRAGVYAHLGSFEPGKVPDRIYYQAVTDGSNEFPEMAMRWAEIIENEGLRRSAILQTARSWAQSDKAGYQAWKNGAKLPVDLEKELPAAN